MRSHSIWIALTLGLVLVAEARAATWVRYAITPDKGELFLDMDSPRQDGALVVATEKYVPHVARFEPEHHRRYAWEIRTRALNCDTHATAVASRTDYDDRGQALFKAVQAYDQLQFLIPQPASLQDEMILEVCDAVRARAPKPAPVQTPSPEAPGVPPPADDVDRRAPPLPVGVGTGWLTTKGYIVTAAHVVGEHRTVALAQDGETAGTATVVAVDPVNDVALLAPVFKINSHPSLPIADTPAQLGQDIFTLGYPAPDQMGLDLKLTTGAVNATSGTDIVHEKTDDLRLIQISAPVQAGNSGGPVIDRRGRVIGIVVSKTLTLGDHDLAQNVNYAMKVRYVSALLAELPDISHPINQAPVPPGDVPSLARSLRGGVFLVMVSKGLDYRF